MGLVVNIIAYKLIKVEKFGLNSTFTFYSWLGDILIAWKLPEIDLDLKGLKSRPTKVFYES